jgi:hypothetical protein
MLCTFGNPLSEDDLLTALDGDASPTVTEHLQKCAYCSQRLEDIRVFEGQLDRLSHPSRQTLLEYHFNMIEGSEADAIGNHLDRCVHCQTILSEYAAETNTLVAAHRSSSLPTGPTRWSLVDQLRETVIRLTTSSELRVAEMGSADGQWLTAGAPGVSLFISIEAQDEHYTIHGQVAADKQVVWNNAVVAIVAIGNQADVTLMALLNELGQFGFSNLVEGTYRLRIRAVSGETLLFEPFNIP